MYNSGLVYQSALNELFPFLLNMSEKADIEFKYVGKAEADGISANVLELIANTPADKKTVEFTTRYFFDSKTNLLLMISQDSVNEFVNSKKRTFYSQNKPFGGLMIPTKIKTEEEIVVKKHVKIMGLNLKSNKQLKITELSVKEFTVNQDFPQSTFAIANKQ